MKYYLQEIAEVFKNISSTENGLSSAEAEKRLEANGKNKLKEGKKKTMLQRILEQLSDPMIIILIVAAVISAITEWVEHGFGFPTDTVIILVVVVINTVLGVIQESKAEAAIEALQEMSAATSKVLRDGKIVSVRSEDLVVGDVVLLEAGDAVPADCRIFESASMKIEEAALTGESVPVGKIIDTLMGGDNNEVPLGDRKNMAYKGCEVSYGRGVGIVVALGEDSELGKIAHAIKEQSTTLSPLQKSIKDVGKILTYFILAVSLVTFIIEVANNPANIMDAFLTAVALAVAAIPESMPAVITIIMSLGVARLAKKKAVVRKMHSVETLGCCNVICSDKTGTLTQNKMTVTTR